MIKKLDVSMCVAEYIKPGMPLDKWLKKQKRKPYAVINASLYESNFNSQTGKSAQIPVGTVIESGKLVHDAGTGYGVGIIGGELSFGTPWEMPWLEYLTGYNCPVQNGRYVAPTFPDSYVFPNRLNRIGIMEDAQGKLHIFTDDTVTLQQFAQHAIENGAKTLCNLDGGASRSLYCNGAQIYSSTRTPYNAIAFWLPEGCEAPQEVCPYSEPTSILGMLSGNGARWLQWQLARRGCVGKDGKPVSVDGQAGKNTAFALVELLKKGD